MQVNVMESNGLIIFFFSYPQTVTSSEVLQIKQTCTKSTNTTPFKLELGVVILSLFILYLYLTPAYNTIFAFFQFCKLLL